MFGVSPADTSDMGEVNTANALMLGISLVEAILLENPSEIAAILRVASPEERLLLLQFTATTVGQLLTEAHGLTGAVERLSSWREGALEGAADA